jgi:hypothetical protein
MLLIIHAFHEKVMQRTPCCSNEHKQNYIYACTLQSYGILKVKNALAKSLCHITEKHICNLASVFVHVLNNFLIQ